MRHVKRTEELKIEEGFTEYASLNKVHGLGTLVTWSNQNTVFLFDHNYRVVENLGERKFSCSNSSHSTFWL